MAYFFPPDLLSLKALLGANGVRTSTLDNPQDVITVANALFSLAFETDLEDEVNLQTMRKQQAIINGIGYANRRLLVRDNLRKLPASVVSRAPANRDKLKGRLKARDRKHMRRLAPADPKLFDQTSS